MDKIIIGALRLWNGKERLNFAFWGVFVPIFFFPIIIFIFSNFKLKVWVFVSVVIFIALKVFSIVALWRCAPNVSYNIALKCGLARFFAALNAFWLAMLSIAFILSLLFW